MRHIIVIRGPTGIGKTTVARCVISRLGVKRAYHLKLDEIRPSIFNRYLHEALNYEFVIGEMYSGNSHTLNPEEWLTQFRERDYVLLSFVLQAPIEQCFNRVRQRKENAIVDHVEYQSLYDWFSKVQELGIFSEKAKVQEITIDARQEPKEIADEIMECIRKEKEKMGS